MVRRIDLNADLGEGSGGEGDLMALVSSCNIACGGHAGDAGSMAQALRLAKAAGVHAGAHPSFPDRANFGRAPSDLTGPALARELLRQICALKAIAARLGVPLTHVKPHGALYNMAAGDTSLARIVASAAGASLPGAALVGPPNSALDDEAARAGLAFLAEGFADRAYEADGRLRAREEPGAVLTSPDAQALQALDMAGRHCVTAHDGAELDLPVETICIHGDTPGALAAARRIRTTLEAAGFTIARP